MNKKDFNKLDEIYLHDAGIKSIYHDTKENILTFELTSIEIEASTELAHADLKFYGVEVVTFSPDITASIEDISIGVSEVTYSQNKDKWYVKWYISVYDTTPKPWGSVISFSATSFLYTIR